METARGGRGRTEAVRRLAEVGIHDPGVADRYPFQLSGGMQQRVAIAAALASDPELLIADEPSTALDVTTQMEILALLHRVQTARGMGLVLITHDLRVAFSICRRIYVLYAGSVLEAAPARTWSGSRCTPTRSGCFCRSRRSSVATSGWPRSRGSVPSPDEVAGRCPFVTRCRWVAPRCSAETRRSARSRRTACRPARVDEIRRELLEARQVADERAPLASRRRAGGRRSCGSKGSRSASAAGAAAVRWWRSRASRSRSARARVSARGRVGVGQDDARPVHRRAGDAYRRTDRNRRSRRVRLPSGSSPPRAGSSAVASR